VTGVRIGRARVTASAAGVQTSTGISVVPEGRIGLISHEGVGAIITADLDGSGIDVVPDNLSLEGAVISWSPDRSMIAISASSLTGAHTTFIGSGDGTFDWLIPEAMSPRLWNPVFSPDGRFVYTHHQIDGVLYRAEIGTQQLDTLLESEDERFVSPTVSRDGSRLAFVAEDQSGTEIRVLSLSTGETTSFRGNFGVVRWSPVSDTLLFIEDEAIKVSAPDGSGKRTISDPAVGYFGYGFGGWAPSLTWSTDGRWAIAQETLPGFVQELHLIEVATGLTLPLRWTSDRLTRAPFWLW
jgi:hypothetical protein